MAIPPSIGDAPQQKLKLVKEATPLPKSRPEVVQLFSRILEKGGVQRVVVQIGQPVTYERLVPEETPIEEDVPPELTENTDPLAAIRNSEMVELSFSTQHSAYEYLFKAFHLLSQKKLRPKLFLIRDYNTLLEWLGVDRGFFNVQELYGVEVREVRDLPKETAILAGVSPEETNLEAITLSVRLSLNVELEKEDEANRGEGPEVGTGGQALRNADGEVGVPAGRLNGAGPAGRPQGRDQGAAPGPGGGHRKRGR